MLNQVCIENEKFRQATYPKSKPVYCLSDKVPSMSIRML